MKLFSQLVRNFKMLKNPNKYAKSIGVNLSENTILLGRTNWGSEPWLISIGNYTRLSKNVTFWNHDGGVSVARRINEKYKNVVKFGFISIGDNCFIGANVTILCNVSIGDNCVIGACSLVTKDVPSGEVWAGVPAKKICNIEDYAEKLLLISANYDPTNLKKNKKEETINISEWFLKIKQGVALNGHSYSSNKKETNVEK